MLTILDSAGLRAAYDQAITDIEAHRGTNQLTNNFYRAIGDSVFDACFTALSQHWGAVLLQGHVNSATPDELKHQAADGYRPSLNVVSAPVGAGKTSFAIAFMMAVTRMGGGGCVFLVDQILKADQLYRDINALMPGKVAVWTTEHDLDRKPSDDRVPVLKKPAARFRLDDLKQYPIAICTHSFFSGSRGDRARQFNTDTRALTICDEKTNDVIVYDVQLSDVADALESLQQDSDPDARVLHHVGTLLDFVTAKANGGSIERPDNDATWGAAAKSLEWFATEEAQRFVRRHRRSTPAMQATFGFARSLAQGYAFIARTFGGTRGAHFVGYKTNMRIVPGMALLDATADIDGVSQLCGWRSHVAVPAARYDNFEIKHVAPYTRANLSKYFQTPRNRKLYRQWIEATVAQFVPAGEKALIVVKKMLLDNEIPKSANYGWNIAGRHVAATHWGGAGIGCNDWRDAGYVLLFDQFHLPRRTVIGTTQGYLHSRASEGPLAAIRSIQGSTPEITAIREGHVWRWSKQLALRGRGRFFDETGMAGKQTLIVASGDFGEVARLAPKLFPGAKVASVKSTALPKKRRTDGKRAARVLEILSGSAGDIVFGDDIAVKVSSSQWFKVAAEVMTADMRASVAGIGWEYVPGSPGRGKRRALFKRKLPEVALC